MSEFISIFVKKVKINATPPATTKPMAISKLKKFEKTATILMQVNINNCSNVTRFSKLFLKVRHLKTNIIKHNTEDSGITIPPSLVRY